MQPFVHHEKYHEEYSRCIAAACEVSAGFVTAAFYDISLSRVFARSVAFTENFAPENAAAELSKLIFMAMREYNIPASSLQKIGFCAPIHISAEIEQQLDPSDMFLRPDTEIVALPFVSAYADSSFAAFLASLPLAEGTLAVQLGKSLNLAFFTGGRLRLASVPLSGAFDGSALESGMRCEFGAIDEVSREANGTVSYCVSGDSDSVGIAPSAALDVVCIMLRDGNLDSDGIMTDRDLFYIGEDYYISQGDVRAVQTDKAKLAAALNCFIERFGVPNEVYLTGEALAQKGFQRLVQLGAVPDSIAEAARFSQNSTESGIVAALTENNAMQRLEQLISAAEDITESIMPGFDEKYMESLEFALAD